MKSINNLLSKSQLIPQNQAVCKRTEGIKMILNKNKRGIITKLEQVSAIKNGDQAKPILIAIYLFFFGCL